MNERNALAVIERQYGTIDDFFIQVIETAPECLDESLPLAQRAQAAMLPTHVFSRVVNSPQFRALVRTELVNRAYGLAGEQRHYETLAHVAQGKRRLVTTAKGDLVEVDQNPLDIIAAGKYLNESRGTPVEQRQGAAGGIYINIGAPDAEVEVKQGEEVLSVRVDSNSEPRVHQARRAGDLPPPGAQARSKASMGQLPDGSEGADASLGAFYGEKAEEEDEEHQIAQKSVRELPDPAEGEVKADARRKQATTPQRSFAERARFWENLPNRKPRGNGENPGGNAGGRSARED